MRTKRLILLTVVMSIVILCMTQTALAETKASSKLYPVSSKGVFSYVDIDGNKVLDTGYGYADDFIGGVAKVMDEFGGTTTYIDTKGKSVDYEAKDYPSNKYREYKDGKVVDIYSNAKKYSTVDEYDWPIEVTEYTIGDGFMIKESLAGGAPRIQLYKNGKLFFTDSKYLDLKEIFIIAKYDDEKMIRIQYSDYSDDCKFKTTYIDYNGNLMWTKPAVTPIKVMLDGNELKLSNAPKIEKDKVLLPAEEILKKLNYKITWNKKKTTMTAKYSKITIVIKTDSQTITVNKKSIKLDRKPKLFNKVLYLPAKNLIEKAGAKYSWDSKTKTITITTTKLKSDILPSNTQTTPNGAIIVNNLNLSKGAYLFAGFDYGDKFDACAIETANVIIAAIEEVAGKKLTEEQGKLIETSLIAASDVIGQPFEITVNGKVYTIIMFPKVEGEATYDINVNVVPVS